MSLKIGTSPDESPPIKIGFLGFHKLFHPTWNNITKALVHRFALEVSDVLPSGHLDPVPDFLFVSVFEANGAMLQHQFSLFGSVGSPTEVPLYHDPRYDGCVKIHVSDECIRPPWQECDYAVTGDHDADPRHLRLPVYVRDHRYILDLPCVRWGKLIRPNLSLSKTTEREWDDIFALKTKFCNFVYSNDHAKERIRFCELLSAYKRVDCGGAVLGNLGYKVEDKIPFLEPYKFTIAFENASYPGYVTEKIYEPMIARSMPIYWGSPTINHDFCVESFVLATGRDFKDVVDEVVALDQDDTLYKKKMRVPWFHGDAPNQYCQPDYFADFMARVFAERKITRPLR